MVKVIWTNRALNDLEDIGEHVAEILTVFHSARLFIERTPAWVENNELHLSLNSKSLL